MGGKRGSSQQLDAACDGLSVAHIASDETRDDPERPGPQRTWELHPQKTDSSTTKNRNLSNKSGISTNKSGSITNKNRALTNKKEFNDQTYEDISFQNLVCHQGWNALQLYNHLHLGSLPGEWNVPKDSRML